jgi:hypothetical protein
MKVWGSMGAVLGNVAWLFLISLGVWLIGTRLFKGTYTYAKAIEATGLAGMINVLGGIIAMLLTVITGNMLVSLGPALLISDFDPANKTHLSLSAFNLMTLWYLAVLALAVARLSGASFAKSAAWLFGVWAVVRFGWILLGVGVPKA